MARITNHLEDRIHDGYTYIINKIVGDTTYLMCSRRTLPCNARAVLNNSTSTLTMTENHVHPKDPLADQKCLFTRDLRHAVMYTTWNVSLKMIYDSVRELHPEASCELTYSSVRSKMARWKSQVQPSVPQSLNHMHAILQENQWSFKNNYSRGEVATVMISTDSLLIYSPNYLKEFVKSEELYVDATYQVAPRINNVQQLFVIMAEKMNYIFPIAWALMENKTTDSYRSILQTLKDILPQLQPLSITADYERAIYSAATAVFPNTNFRG